MFPGQPSWTKFTFLLDKPVSPSFVCQKRMSCHRYEARITARGNVVAPRALVSRAWLANPPARPMARLQAVSLFLKNLSRYVALVSKILKITWFSLTTMFFFLFIKKKKLKPIQNNSFMIVRLNPSVVSTWTILKEKNSKRKKLKLKAETNKFVGRRQQTCFSPDLWWREWPRIACCVFSCQWLSQDVQKKNKIISGKFQSQFLRSVQMRVSQCGEKGSRSDENEFWTPVKAKVGVCKFLMAWNINNRDQQVCVTVSGMWERRCREPLVA